MEPAANSRKRQLITTLAVLIVIVAIVAAVTITNKKKPDMANTSDLTTPAKTDTTSPSPTSTQDSSPTTSAPTTSAAYKDGTYTATGSYDSPGGRESITITVTLANDAITATSATSGANDPEAHEYQDQFIASYKRLVVGKKISDILLSRVSGSSLTSQGFNSAIQKIESQAKA
jgi:uncharacterized protein with FMN-binding domain